jgi:hypothetical protein
VALSSATSVSLPEIIQLSSYMLTTKRTPMGAITKRRFNQITTESIQKLKIDKLEMALIPSQLSLSVRYKIFFLKQCDSVESDTNILVEQSLYISVWKLTETLVNISQATRCHIPEDRTSLYVIPLYKFTPQIL